MSKPIDRSAFKPTSVQTLKDRDKELGVTQGDSSRLKIEPGQNIFRIYPAHPEGGGGSFTEGKVVHWLPMDIEERKDGEVQYDSKGQPKTKRISKPIFNSKIHGNTEKDVIDEYIKFAEKYAKDTYSKEDERKKFLEPIFGDYTKKIQPITEKPSWVMYADKLTIDANNVVVSKTFGDLEIGKAVKFRLNAISASESSNEPLGTDPFSDIEDGRAIIITYDDKAKKPQDYYITEMFAPLVKGGKGQITLYPISDEDLEKFLAEKPLAKRFRNCYTRKDYDFAIKGLKILDDENNLGIFQHEEFMNIIEEISQYYPEIQSDKEQIEEMFDKGKGKTEVKETVTKTSPIKKAAEISQSTVQRDGFDDMDRKELVAFARDEETGIIVRPSHTDEQIRNMLREWDAQQSPGEVIIEQEEQPETTSTSESIAAMRKKLGKK